MGPWINSNIEYVLLAFGFGGALASLLGDIYNKKEKGKRRLGYFGISIALLSLIAGILVNQKNDRKETTLKADRDRLQADVNRLNDRSMSILDSIKNTNGGLNKIDNKIKCEDSVMRDVKSYTKKIRGQISATYDSLKSSSFKHKTEVLGVLTGALKQIDSLNSKNELIAESNNALKGIVENVRTDIADNKNVLDRAISNLYGKFRDSTQQQLQTMFGQQNKVLWDSLDTKIKNYSDNFGTQVATYVELIKHQKETVDSINLKLAELAKVDNGMKSARQGLDTATLSKN